jgi:hypothetical protein
MNLRLALLALSTAILACQTLARNPTATPSPPLVTDSGVLVRDDFADPASGWGTGADADGSLDYENGQYVFRVTTDNFFTWGNLARRVFENIRVEVEVENRTESAEPTFGVICHYQNEGNFYYAGFGSDGFYAIVRSQDRADTFLSSDSGKWVQSDAITRNAESYDLAVVCADGSITLEVDGEIIASVDDEVFASGQIGLFVLTFEQPEAHVRFDHLTVTEVK